MTKKERLTFVITLAIAVALELVGFDAWLYGQLPWWAILLPVAVFVAGWVVYAVAVWFVWWVIAGLLD